MPDAVVPAPAATLLLLRDGPDGLEVLMMERPAAAGFAAGAMVFPGGRIEPSDRELGRHCSAAHGIAEDALVFRIAAIRETFEECGVLLARRDGAMVPGAALEALRRSHREAIGADFAAFVAQAGLELAIDALVPYAHWITPVDRKKRFDTHFYLAMAPSDQQAAHDGQEAMDTVWTTPNAALRAAEEGRYKLIFATLMNLGRLGRSATVAEALATARRAAIVTVCPEWVTTSAGEVIRIPEAAGYGAGELPATGMRRG
jgi:8-oxo-dGTP pyrophosphatase MutT (NUDIX family)